jgi:hypothetical protein
MAYITRQGKGSRMTIPDLDGTLNYLYTSSANASTSSISASYASTASYLNNFEIPTYIEVTIDSTQILNLGKEYVPLLESAGPDNYYDVQKIIIEYTYDSIPYSLNDYLMIYGTNSYAYLSANFITEAFNTATVINNYGSKSFKIGDDYLNVLSAQTSNMGIRLSTYGGDDPTDGDGTLLVKIWYIVRTSGTEL